MCKRHLVLLSILTCMVNVVLANGTNKNAPVYFYASEFTLPGIEMACASQTIDVIRKAIAPRELRVVQLTTIEEVDNVFRSSGEFVAVVGASTYWRHLRDGIRDIATLVSKHQPDPDHAVGALIVVKDSRRDIKDVLDLQGKSIAVNEINGFQGIQVVFREISESGFNWRNFFSSVKPYGLDFRRRLEAVRNGEADAATVNVCYAERMRDQGIDVLKGLRPIGVKEQSSVSCLTSTRLYPNWSLLASPELDSNTRVKIANAIYAMTPVDDGQRWTMASDFRETDELYRVLKTGPYLYLDQWTFKRIWDEYQPLVLSAFALILFFIWHFWQISRVVVIKTSQLRETMHRYEKTRQALIIAQLSTMVAHELSQPLSGILLYTRGMRKILNESTRTNSKLSVALDGIESHARKANNIVTYVRKYSKGSESAFEKINLIDLIHRSIDRVKLAWNGSANNYQLRCGSKNIFLMGSPLELEIAFSNIFENSLQAVENNCKINIDIREEDNIVHVIIMDNGKSLDDDLFQKLKDPLTTTKSYGLGMGIMIVRCIVERHAGSVDLTKSNTGGLQVTIDLPITK